MSSDDGTPSPVKKKKRATMHGSKSPVRQQERDEDEISFLILNERTSATTQWSTTTRRTVDERSTNGRRDD